MPTTPRQDEGSDGDTGAQVPKKKGRSPTCSVPHPTANVKGATGSGWVALSESDVLAISEGRPALAAGLLRVWIVLLFEARQQGALAFTIPTDVLAHRAGFSQRHVYSLLRELCALGLVTATTARKGGRYAPLAAELHPTVGLFHRRNSTSDGSTHRRNSMGGVSSSESYNSKEQSPLTPKGASVENPGYEEIEPGVRRIPQSEIW